MLLAALTAFNELTVSALLWSAGTQTVGVMVFSLQYEGNSGEAAALSVLATLLVAVLAFLADRLGRGAPGALPWRD
jgi:iron(III) transport system permease protein